ncbi:hypothetical protein N7492_010343 [Penicillium capsulatum]|uniref:Uncharacterized protein n=1 Tax=Penicillium capsulatum TaxID=69766 RepID=A0A9W9LF12_9EURO|nr:hypothetical protein N7492_010343 [Penicillium capsulatum]KAJ6112848.1 hypothetical protein N7512_008172 [Penicillium capsulatum]
MELVFLLFLLCTIVSARAVPASASFTAWGSGTLYRDDYHEKSPSLPANRVTSSDSLHIRDPSSVQLDRRAQQLSWEDSITKGRKIWDHLQRYLRLDNPPEGTKYPGRWLNRYQLKEQNERAVPPKVLHDSLKADGISTGPNWQYIWVQQDNMGNSVYQDLYHYDTTQRVGLIVVNWATRGDRALLPWSEVAYQQYKKSPGADLTRLKYIYQPTISTVSTLDIMARAVGTGEYINQDVCDEKEEWMIFPSSPSPSDSFLALLGSLGKRSIQEIQLNLGLSSMKLVLTT